MATWSIEPSGGLASIDNTGKLTYQEHTEDKTYTIKYVGDDGCTDTKPITIKKCEGPTPCPKDWRKIDDLIINNNSTQSHTFSDIKFRHGEVQYTITFSVNVPGEGTESIPDATISPSIPEGTTMLTVQGASIRADGVTYSDALFTPIRLTDCALRMEVTFD